MIKIHKFFIYRPALAYLIFIIFIFLGYYSYRVIPKRQYPLVYSNAVTITTNVPHALPEEIEQVVTIPLEKVITKIIGVYDITSVSKKDVSIIKFKLDDNYPIDDTLASIHRTVSSVNLPTFAEQPTIVRPTRDSPFMRIAVSGTENKKKLLSAALAIKYTIEKIALVEKVEIFGLPNERITIELLPEKLLYYDITVLEIADALKANQYQLSCGTINSDKGKIYIQSGKSMENIATIKNILLRANLHNNSIKLKHIGNVFYEFPEPDTFERLNGSPMVRLKVSPIPRTDTIKISNYIQSVLKDMSNDFDSGIHVNILGDNTNDIRRRIHILLSNGIWGSLIVFFLIILFMDFRSLVLISMGIIFSLCGMLLFMNLSSMTINVASLFGMIIVLGMLVDDSIMISENINRHLMIKNDSDLHTTVLTGVQEMVKPVTLTVLTTIIAFYPLTHLEGWIGKMVRDIPIIVLCALSCSIFESIFLMPSHTIECLKLNLFHKHSQNSSNIKEKRWFEKLKSIYVTILEKSLKWRYLLLCGGILFLVLAWYIYQYKLKFSPFPQDTAGGFFITAKINNNTDVLPLIKKVEDYLKDNPFDGYTATHTRVICKDSYYDINFYIKSITMTTKKLSSISKKYKEEINPFFKNHTFSITREGGGISQTKMTINIKGPNLSMLKNLSNQFQEFLNTVPGIIKTEDDFTEYHRGLSIKINELAAQRSGVAYTDIANTIKYLMGENEVLILPQANNELSFNIRLKHTDNIKDFPHILRQLIKTKKDRLIPLSQLATYSLSSGITEIKHYDGYRTIKITINFNEEKTTAKEIKAQLKKLSRTAVNKHPGYIIEYGEEQKDIQKTLSSLQFALIISLILIFTLLYLIFNSVLQPLIIMSIVPFGIASSILALFFHGKYLSILAMLGMASLIGVIINDSVVFVDFINNHKGEFVNIKAAVLEAGRKRFKQIILTTLTSLGGLLPLAYGIGGKDNILMALALTFCWGLGCGTLFTLFFVPYFYLIIEDIKRLVWKKNSI